MLRPAVRAVCGREPVAQFNLLFTRALRPLRCSARPAQTPAILPCRAGTSRVHTKPNPYARERGLATCTCACEWAAREWGPGLGPWAEELACDQVRRAASVMNLGGRSSRQRDRKRPGTQHLPATLALPTGATRIPVRLRSASAPLRSPLRAGPPGAPHRAHAAPPRPRRTRHPAAARCRPWTCTRTT